MKTKTSRFQKGVALIVGMSFATIANAGATISQDSLCRIGGPTRHSGSVCYFAYPKHKRTCMCDSTTQVGDRTGPNIPGWNSHELDKQFLAKLNNRFDAAQGSEKSVLGAQIKDFRRAMGRERE